MIEKRGWPYRLCSEGLPFLYSLVVVVMGALRGHTRPPLFSFFLSLFWSYSPVFFFVFFLFFFFWGGGGVTTTPCLTSPIYKSSHCTPPCPPPPPPSKNVSSVPGIWPYRPVGYGLSSLEVWVQKGRHGHHYRQLRGPVTTTQSAHCPLRGVGGATVVEDSLYVRCVYGGGRENCGKMYLDFLVQEE